MANITSSYDPEFTAKKIKELREKYGYTGNELLEKSNSYIGASNLCHIEKDGKYLTIYELMRLAFGLKVSVDVLIYKNPTKEENTAQYRNNEYLPEYTGHQIQLLRLKNNMSQNTFAAVVGFGRPYLSSVENGHQSPSVNVLVAIADALHVPLSRLVYQYADTQDAANTYIKSDNHYCFCSLYYNCSSSAIVSKCTCAQEIPKFRQIKGQEELLNE